MRDDRHMILTGSINRRTDNDYAWLKDSTGRIHIDDDERYRVDKRVRVTGEGDRDDGNSELSVDSVYMLKQCAPDEKPASQAFCVKWPDKFYHLPAKHL